jgi:hypothetical protein
MDGLTAEIRRKMPGVLLALLMMPMTGITCFPHSRILYQHALGKLRLICAKNHVRLVDYTETDVRGFSDRSSVPGSSAYAYQKAVP